jgi:ATP-dependent Clp protease ATP-binding subunit ClpA
MFERFTTEARETVVRARGQAIELRHPAVGTEHLLLSMADDTGVAGDVLRSAGITAESVKAKIQQRVPPAPGLLTAQDAEALRSVGIDLDAVLARIEESFGPDALLPPAHTGRGWFGRKRGTGGRFGPGAKKVLELSLREALRLKDNHISSGHVLLGLLRAGEGMGAQILAESGADLTVLRARTEQALRNAA